MQYVVYVLRSFKDSKLYIGQTNNIDGRIKRHNSGLVRATKFRRPLKLVYSELYNTRKEAMSREKYLKSLKGSLERKLKLEFNK